MDADDFEWAAMKILASGQRAMKSANEAKLRNKHPDLIKNLLADHAKSMRIGQALIKEAEFCRDEEAGHE